MHDRFIKFIPSEESLYLQEKYPFAMLLLMLIAQRARRTAGHPDGLEIGEAQIGDYKKAGLQTRGQYRHALSILISRAHIKIVETSRTRKNATITTTTEGTKVKLLRSDVWDINFDYNNHQSNQRTTIEQPSNNHEQECKERKECKEEHKEKIKKEKVPELQKIAVRENVHLTQEEYNSLIALHGEVLLFQMLDILDSYKGASGKKYKSDYHTMKQGGWVVNKAKENHGRTQKSPLPRSESIKRTDEPRFIPRTLISFPGN